jgi:hypothetical protein
MTLLCSIHQRSDPQEAGVISSDDCPKRAPEQFSFETIGRPSVRRLLRPGPVAETIPIVARRVNKRHRRLQLDPIPDHVEPPLHSCLIRANGADRHKRRPPPPTRGKVPPCARGPSAYHLRLNDNDVARFLPAGRRCLAHRHNFASRDRVPRLDR